MCHFLAEIISRWCVYNLHIDQDQKEKIWYGMEVFLELLWKLIAIMVIGLIMKNKGVYFLSIFSFCLLRIWVGGKHFHSSIICFGFMVLVGYLPVCVGKIYIIPWYLGEAFLIFSFGIVEKYSLYNQWYLSEEKKQKRKLCAYIVLILYILSVLFTKIQEYRNAILFGNGMEIFTIIWERVELKDENNKED